MRGLRLSVVLAALLLGLALGSAVEAREETYTQCYVRVIAEGGSVNMVRWICGLKSGWWDWDKKEPMND
jgi:hypothetical protein